MKKILKYILFLFICNCLFFISCSSTSVEKPRKVTLKNMYSNYEEQYKLFSQDPNKQLILSEWKDKLISLEDEWSDTKELYNYYKYPDDYVFESYFYYLEFDPAYRDLQSLLFYYERAVIDTNIKYTNMLNNN